MVLSVLSLIAVLNPHATVTLNAPAQTLDHLMVSLSQATSERLSVSSALAKEVVTLNVKDADSTEVLQKLAKVTGGVWVSTSDGQRLDKDTTLESLEKQQALAERTAFLKAEIAKQVAELAKMPVFDPEKIKQANQGQGGPGGRGQQGANTLMFPGNRAIVQTLATMRADDLARIAIGQRVVYTSAPTQMQRPLPGNPMLVMRTFASDQMKFAAKFGSRGGQARQPQNNQPAAQPEVLVPAKAFLIVTRLGMGNALNLNYIVADTNGRSIGNANMTLGQDFQSDQNQSAGSKDSTDSAIVLSDLGKAAVQAFARMGGRGDVMSVRLAGGNANFVTVSGDSNSNPGTPSPELADLLRDPVKNDPLSFHVNEAVNAAAKGKNLIALLPDSLAGQMSQALSGNRTPDQIVGLAKDSWKLDVEQTDTWLTIAPKRRLDARLERVDRAALKVLIDATAKKGSARLDDIAIYATKAPPVTFGGVDVAVMRLVDSASSQALNAVYSQNRDMLVMWAGMGTGVRQGLARGQRLTIPAVSNNSVALTADMVYNSYDGPSVQRQQTGPNGQPGGPSGVNGRNASQATLSNLSVDFAVALPAPAASQQGGRPGGPGGLDGFRPGMMVMPGSMAGDMTVERTEVLPRGVPGGTTLMMSMNSEVVAKAVRKDAGLSRSYSAQSLGAERAMSEMPADPNGRRPQQQNIAWDGYVPGTRTMYQFIFELAPGITLRRSLDDMSYDVNAKVGSYDQLPTDFQNKVTQQYQQMKEMMTQRLNRAGQEMRVAQGRRGGGTKPPAP